MKHRYQPGDTCHRLPALITVPGQLCVPDAELLIEWLRDTACAIEEHYADSLEQYRSRPDPRQHNLWPPNDPPF